MKDQKISIRIESQLLDDITYEYFKYELFKQMSFSEYIRQMLKKGNENRK